MTGFARREGAKDELSWVWEVRSVNGRGLDVRFRLPNGLDRLEPILRQAANGLHSRGNLQVSLTVDTEVPSREVKLNTDLVKALIAETEPLRKELGSGPSLDSLLSVRGVLEVVEAGTGLGDGSFDDVLVADFENLMKDLSEARENEGAQLAAVLGEQLAAMTSLVAAAVQLQPECQKKMKERLQKQIEELTSRTKIADEGQLEQELAQLLVKSDVTEEIDRLSAHIGAARDLLGGGGVIGRKLDFLVQELNRESNTLCAKSSHMGLTQIGLDLKALVDQFREQALNVE